MRAGKVGALPANGGTYREVVGVGDSVHFAGYRSHVARAEDIINANTQRPLLIRITQFAETALQEAVSHAPAKLTIDIGQRNGVEIAHCHHRVRRLVDSLLHRLGLLLAQLAGVMQLLTEAALLEVIDREGVQLKVLFHETKTLQVIHNEANGVLLDDDIALAADVVF